MKNKKGFTLVEILIVMCVIGILAAMAVPAFCKVRETTHLEHIKQCNTMNCNAESHTYGDDSGYCHFEVDEVDAIKQTYLDRINGVEDTPQPQTPTQTLVEPEDSVLRNENEYLKNKLKSQYEKTDDLQGRIDQLKKELEEVKTEGNRYF